MGMFTCLTRVWLMKQSSAPESIKNSKEKDLLDQNSVPGRDRPAEMGQEEAAPTSTPACAGGLNLLAVRGRGEKMARLSTEQADPRVHPSLPLRWMELGLAQFNRLLTGGLAWP